MLRRKGEEWEHEAGEGNGSEQAIMKASKVRLVGRERGEEREGEGRWWPQEMAESPPLCPIYFPSAALTFLTPTYSSFPLSLVLFLCPLPPLTSFRLPINFH